MVSTWPTTSDCSRVGRMMISRPLSKRTYGGVHGQGWRSGSSQG